ncbi:MULTISPECIES: restriction endonuclease subunit S [unclassified Streptomyces]|uniref:restriction endonuclease subunit S n=1 Tax=unclassified Streptomyces TaxID=2593676 RepID=UPI0036E28D06
MSVSFASRWGNFRIKSIASKIGSGKTPSGGAESYTDEGIIFLRSQNIHFDGLRLDDVAYIDDETHHEMLGTHVRPGDVLLNITGASLGRVTYAPADMRPANVNQHVCIIRPTGSEITRYLAYSLASLPGQQQISELQVGGNREGLNFEQVGNLLVPAAPLETQRQIADFLDAEIARIDALIRARSTQLQRLEELWESHLAGRIEQLIAQHGLIPLRRAVSSVEQGWSPQCHDTEATPAEWAVLKTSAVSSGNFLPLEHKRLPGDLEPELRYQIRDGDILLTRGSGSPTHVGVAAVARTEGRRLLLSDLLYRVRLTQGWNPEFTRLALSSRPVRGFMALLFRGQSGQTIKLRSEDVKAINIPAIPSELQTHTTKQLSEMQQRIGATQKAIRRSNVLLAERRQALITAAVTGQFDVSTASGRGVEIP